MDRLSRVISSVETRASQSLEGRFCKDSIMGFSEVLLQLGLLYFCLRDAARVSRVLGLRVQGAGVYSYRVPRGLRALEDHKI